MQAVCRDRTIEYYANNHDRLIKIAKGRLDSPQDAEDAVQEAFTRALKYAHTYDPSRPFEGWFVALLQNAIRDQHKYSRMGGMTTDELPEDELVDDNNLDLPYEELRKLIQSKEGNTKDILQLYFFAEHTPRDIHEILGVPNKTIRMCIYRFKKEVGGVLSPD